MSSFKEQIGYNKYAYREGQSVFRELCTIPPSAVAQNRELIENSLITIGSGQDLSTRATIGAYAYSFWNICDPKLIPSSCWYINKGNGVLAVFNEHRGRNINHTRYFVHTRTVDDAIQLVPELAQFAPEEANNFRFVIPVPGREYPDGKVQKQLARIGFRLSSNPVTVAQMYWPDRSSFRFSFAKPSGTRLIDPLTAEYYIQARNLFDEHYPIHSFKAEELGLTGLHAGLVTQVFNYRKHLLVGVIGRTEPIVLDLKTEKDRYYKLGILRDAVVDKEFRNRGAANYLASMQAKHLYDSGVDVIGLDATSEAAEQQVRSLGAQCAGWRRWYVFSKKDESNDYALSE